MNEFAILGATASGKTALSIEYAKRFDGIVLSLDSLSVYKHIDIASAKPTKDERGDIKHFGIDVLEPDGHFDVTLFFTLYKQAREYALANKKTLIIVGGTSFYLKSLLTGLSQKPAVSEQVKQNIARYMSDPNSAYDLMQSVDKQYAQKIASNDKYRIEKWLEIYLQTNTVPSEYLQSAKKEPLIKNIKIYNILSDKEVLKQRIKLRTKNMLSDGLIDEVCSLEKSYGRSPNAMQSIGIKETLDYLDGRYTLDELEEKIVTNTAKLAKRQRTFNKSQFDGYDIEHLSLQDLQNKVLNEN